MNECDRLRVRCIALWWLGLIETGLAVGSIALTRVTLWAILPSCVFGWTLGGVIHRYGKAGAALDAHEEECHGSQA